MVSAQRTPGASASPDSPAVGSLIKDCAECPQLVVVPAGQFLLGSPPEEPDREADESPQHTVAIAKPFAAGSGVRAANRNGGCPENGEPRT